MPTSKPHLNSMGRKLERALHALRLAISGLILESAPASFAQRLRFFISNMLAFALISFFIFWLRQDSILFTGNQYHLFANLLNQIGKEPLLSLSANTLVYGNIDFGVNARLLPSFVLAALAPEHYAPLIVYLVASVELFFAILLFACLFRLSLLAAAAVAWIACFLVLPFSWPCLVWIEISNIVPGMISLSALYLIEVGLFFRIGRGSRSEAVVLAIALAATSIYAFLAFTHFSVLFAYLSIWTCGWILLLSANVREACSKLAAGAVSIASLYLLSFSPYVIGYYGHMWRSLIEQGTSTGFGYFSVLISNIPAIYQNFNVAAVFPMAASTAPAVFSLSFLLFTLISSTGLFLLFLSRRQTALFQLPALFLGTLVGYLLWPWSYLESVLGPLWALMCALGVLSCTALLAEATTSLLRHYHRACSPAGAADHSSRLLSSFGGPIRRAAEWLVRSFGRYVAPFFQSVFLRWSRLGFPAATMSVQGAVLAFVFLVMGTAILFQVLATRNSPAGYANGAAPEGAIFDRIEQDIRLSGKGLFRGRLANISMFELTIHDARGRGYVYEAQEALDHDMAFALQLKADLRRSMQAKHIPMLYDLSRFAAPASVAAMNYYLTSPMHFKQEQFFFPTVYNEKWLAFFGVRYVISENSALADRRVAAADMGEYQLFLYEVPDPNVGNYSPVATIVSTSAKEMLQIMGRPDFDFRKTAVVERKIPSGMVRAIETELFIENGSLVFHGTSGGRSLVILPFEYSNCLVTRRLARDQGNPFELLRVNSQQIGVLFERAVDIRITFEYGPFNNPHCRRRDAADWKSLDVKALATLQGVGIFGGLEASGR